MFKTFISRLARLTGAALRRDHRPMLENYYESTGEYAVLERETTIRIRFPASEEVISVQVGVSAEGMLIFEGDIALMNAESLMGAEALAIAAPGARWPNATVPYVVESGDAAKIADAIDEWNARTRIRLTPRNAEAHYIVFRQSNVISSSAVGRQGGPQIVSVLTGAPSGTIKHEIGHAVGLWHEHTRPDRDTHITVHRDNINPPARKYFAKQTTNATTLGLPYDYESIMHYEANAFSINPLTLMTLTPIVSGAIIGQRARLSDTDIAAVASMYP